MQSSIIYGCTQIQIQYILFTMFLVLNSGKFIHFSSIFTQILIKINHLHPNLKLNYYITKRSMKIQTYKIVILLLLVLGSYANEKLVCYSKSKLQSEAIYQFFTGVRNGYFVDVYPEAPIIDSSTVYLESKAWSGVNVLADNQTLDNFKYARIYDNNIAAKMSPQQMGGAQVPSLNGLNITYSQLCDRYIKKQINLLVVPQDHLQMLLQSTIVDTANLQSLCRPDVILIKQYGNDKMSGDQRKQFEGKGYQQVNSYQNFVFLFKKQKVQFYQQLQTKNKLHQQTHADKLISFSSIIQSLASKTLNKAVSMNEIKTQIVNNQLYIHFSRIGAIFDIAQLKDNNNLPDHFLLMETNQKYSMLRIPKQHIKQEDINLADRISFTHITYSPPNQKIKHVFVFQHDFDQSVQKQSQIVRLSDQVKPFNGKQIKQYKIDDVQKWNQTKTKPNTDKNIAEQKVSPPVIDGQKQKQAKQLAQEKEKLRKEKQKLQQELDAKNRDILERQKSIMQKQANLKKREQEQKQKQAARKKKQLTPSLTPSSKQNSTSTSTKPNTPDSPTSTKQQISSIGSIHSKQSISNLTPQSALNKDNILQNPAMLIVILVSSVVGAAMLAALVTACIMRRNKRANVLRKIRNNSNLHSEHEHDQGTEQHGNQNQNQKGVGSQVDDIVIKH